MHKIYEVLREVMFFTHFIYIWTWCQFVFLIILVAISLLSNNVLCYKYGKMTSSSCSDLRGKMVENGCGFFLKQNQMIK